MIETVIKRDGTREKFIPEKINDWGKWAANNNTNVDWGGAVMQVVSLMPSVVTTKRLQESLIKHCLDKDTWEYNKMAGRLYAASLSKDFYDDRVYPHIKKLHDEMINKGLIVKPNYTEHEYDVINNMIEHNKDLTYSHYAISHMVHKVSIRDRVSEKFYETPQFIFMRVVMQTFNNYHEKDRLLKIKELYYFLSERKINVPTPYYSNSLTKNSNVASCAVLTCDDTWESIGVMNALAYALTTTGAGLGVNFKTRSINDNVRGGLIRHQGKVPYIRGLAHTIKSSIQGTRGGASTIYFPYFDPEIKTLLGLKNPLSVEAARVRQCDYAVAVNSYLFKKAAKKENVYLFSVYDNSELYELFYSANSDKFEEEMELFAKNNPDKVTTISAMEILKSIASESMETGRVYLFFADEANKHTPYKDKIYSSNLCNEIFQPTKPFMHYSELYDVNSDGQVAFCNLAGIIPARIENDEEYEKAAYYSLLMIDEGINNSVLPFPQLNKSIRDNRSAGVGIVGLAHYLALNDKKYTTQDGKDFIHVLAEKHAYYLYEAALKLAKERGLPDGIVKTKFPDGWTPIDDYNKNVDELVTVGFKKDWKGLSKRIKDFGGIRFTTVTTIPPSEASSIFSEETNSIYPPRSLSMVKVFGDHSVKWVAPDATELKDKYEIAWKVPNKDHIQVYAIIQKFVDQGISADLYNDRVSNRKIKLSDIIQEMFWQVKYGMKGRYYVNSLVEKDINIGSVLEGHESKCSSGACTL